jgi:hypothetical protein
MQHSKHGEGLKSRMLKVYLWRPRIGMCFFVKYLFIFVLEVLLKRSIMSPFMSGFESYENSLPDVLGTVEQLH